MIELIVMNDYLEMARERERVVERGTVRMWCGSKTFQAEPPQKHRAKHALPGNSLVRVNYKSLDKLGSVLSKMSSYII